MRIFYNIRWTLKQFKVYPLQTLINIVGLATGITVFALIALYVNHQYKVNMFHKNADKIYRIEDDFGGITPATYLPFIQNQIPELKDGCRIGSFNVLVHYQPDEMIDVNKGVYTSTLFADSSFFKMFDFQLLKGNIQHAFTDPNSILISESQSIKIFGDRNPMNKQITFDGDLKLTVKGIFKDVTGLSSLRFQAVVPFDFYKNYFHDPQFLESWNRWMYETYVLVDDNKSADVLKIKMKDMLIDRYITKYNLSKEEADSNVKLNLRKYNEIYLSDSMDRHYHGSKKQILIFSIIAVFVLIIACINYINIATAMAANRFKTMGIHKISGANRRSLIFMVLTEGIIIAFISIAIATLWIEFLLPYFRKLVDLELQIPYSFWLIFSVFIMVPLVLGIISSIFPSVYLSSFNVIDVLKGEFVKGKSGNTFRKILIISQFSISVFLIAGTILVKKQLNFINHYDPGYQMEQVVYSVSNNLILDHYDVFKSRLLENPDILGVTRCNMYITQSGTVWTVNDGKDRSITALDYRIDEDFLDFFGIKVISGRGFTEDDLKRKDGLTLVNNNLAKWYGGLDTVLTKKIYDIEIIGVVNDIHSTSLHEELSPATFTLDPQRTYVVYYKIRSEKYQETLKYISDVWNDIAPQFPFEHNFLEDEFEKIYKSEIKFGQIFMIFGLLSIFIASIGLFAMSSFIAIKRTKEIGIRKSVGASTWKIILLLSKELSVWVLLANLIAIPLSWVYLNNWLNAFAYKTTLSWWIFALSAIISLLIALSTIFYHTITTASKNPVDSLRYE